MKFRVKVECSAPESLNSIEEFENSNHCIAHLTVGWHCTSVG
jgi:hypothetical protein